MNNLCRVIGHKWEKPLTQDQADYGDIKCLRSNCDGYQADWRLDVPFTLPEAVYVKVILPLQHGAALLVCRYRGHALVDESTAGPDSGNMDHSCRRCGQYWHVPLY